MRNLVGSGVFDLGAGVKESALSSDSSSSVSSLLTLGDMMIRLLPVLPDFGDWMVILDSCLSGVISCNLGICSVVKVLSFFPLLSLIGT